MIVDRTREQQQKHKHVPERTCVGCRETKPKRTMVRVVRTVAGAVVVDPSGKLAGRGAYLCNDPNCWEVALKRGALDHALKTKVPQGDIQSLRSYAETISWGTPREEEE